jgi:phospholipid/cholesterol/gamma-HCH transport system substrate-binding protein
MNIFADYDQRFAGLEKKVAWFLGAAALAAIIVLIGIVTKQQLFASTTSLYFYSSDATDLYEGMAVKMRGFNVGKVQQVTMESDAGIKVRLEIKNQYMHFIRAGSVFHLAGKNLFEDTVINIKLAPINNPEVEPGATLQLVRAPGISDLAGRLVQQIEPVLVELRQAAASINDQQGDVHRLLRNADATVSKFAESSHQFNTLMQHSEALVTEEKTKLGKLLDGGNMAVANLNETLPVTLKTIGTVVENVEAATVDLKRLVAESADVATPLLKDSKAMLDDSRDIIGATKNSWPVRTLMDRPFEKTLTPDSYVPEK